MAPNPFTADQMREKAAGLYTIAAGNVNANRPLMLAAKVLQITRSRV